MSAQWFPIQGESRRGSEYRAPARVPWSAVERLRPSIEQQHGQTLERMAQRGGLGRWELYAHAHGISIFERLHVDVDAWFAAFCAEAEKNDHRAQRIRDIVAQQWAVAVAGICGGAGVYDDEDIAEKLPDGRPFVGWRLSSFECVVLALAALPSAAEIVGGEP